MKTPKFRTMSIALLLRILAPLVFMITVLTVTVYAVNATATPTPTSLPFGLTNDSLVFAGVILGITARLFFPYLAKAKAAALQSTTAGTPPTKFTFDHRYGYIAIFNIFQAGILSALFFTQAPTTGGFVGAFSWAYASQDIFSQFL
jgi:hypothetical protein